MMPSWVGTIMVATTTASSPLRPRKRSFAKAKPASVEVNTTLAVTVTATRVELVRASHISVCENALRRFSSRWLPGTSAGGTLAMAELSREAATSDQYTGNSEMTTTRPSRTYV